VPSSGCLSTIRRASRTDPIPAPTQTTLATATGRQMPFTCLFPTPASCASASPYPTTMTPSLRPRNRSSIACLVPYPLPHLLPHTYSPCPPPHPLPPYHTTHSSMIHPSTNPSSLPIMRASPATALSASNLTTRPRSRWRGSTTPSTATASNHV